MDRYFALLVTAVVGFLSPSPALDVEQARSDAAGALAYAAMAKAPVLPPAPVKASAAPTQAAADPLPSIELTSCPLGGCESRSFAHRPAVKIVHVAGAGTRKLVQAGRAVGRFARHPFRPRLRH